MRAFSGMLKRGILKPSLSMAFITDHWQGAVYTPHTYVVTMWSRTKAIIGRMPGTFYSRVFCGRLASVLLRTENELFDQLTCPCRRYLGCRSQVSANTPSLQDHSFKSGGDHLLLWFRSCRTINIALSRRSSGRQLLRSWISWISILDINFR